ncbi:MAG: hypothetical protein ACOCQ6_01985 [Bacteroidota bacterium]
MLFKQSGANQVVKNMEEQIKHFILQLFFSRSNPRLFNKVIRDMRKAHSDEKRNDIVKTIRERMEKEGLAFIAPAMDNDEFRNQVYKALSFLETPKTD